jgi:hypothetical protein
MSKVEVNQISSQCGSTLTIGQSGDTVTLAAGATQTGFGRTGTVDWDTTAKTASFTAVSGNGYFVNTTSGAITVTLPAGSAGAIVSLADYAATWQTNNLTVSPNGTDKIGSVNADVTLSTEGQSVTFVYVDSTQGWINTMDSTSNVRGNAFIAATGGTVTCCGDYKIHTFTGPGTFTVTNAGTPTGSDTVDYLVVAGGGGSGGNLSHIQQGGGGGGGGYRESSGAASGCYTISPLGACVSALPVSVTGYPITVGAGGGRGGAGGGCGLPNGPQATSGGNSIFSTITSNGGGFGGQPVSCGIFQATGQPGGSGGGGGGGNGAQAGGSGNTPPVSPPQGGNGGPGQNGGPTTGGSGGGATGNGVQGPSSGATGPAANTGGTGATNFITGSSVTRATGGNWGQYCGPTWHPISDATANTGNGANANSGSAPGNMPTSPPANVDEYWRGKNGGSGIVIIRYKYQ